MTCDPMAAMLLRQGLRLYAGRPVVSAAELIPWIPKNGALHGFAVDHLMRINLAAIAALLVVAHVVLVLGLLKRRQGRIRLRLVLPLALICGLYVWMAVTAQRLWAVDRFEGPSLEAMQVEVVGVQFQWYFRYPGRDATFGATRPQLVNAGAGDPLGIDPADPDGSDDVVGSELVLPVGREVDLRLRAHDVIHGLFIPGMRLKQNAVPGLILHVHFTPVETGSYPILCTQVCGLGHARMQAQLRVVSPADFAAWMAARERKRLAESGLTDGAL